MTAITITAFNTDNMMTEVDRFDDCRRIELFGVQDIARKHGGGRTADQTIRTKLVDLLKEMAGAEGRSIPQPEVLALAVERQIASIHTLRTIMVECAGMAGVTVVIQRGRPAGQPGVTGPRDATVVRERLFREAIAGLMENNPDGVTRDEFEAFMSGEGFKPAYIKSSAGIVKELGLIIHDRPRATRKPDAFRLEVTRKALAAADAAGLRTREAICTTVLRFWQAHGVECAHTTAAAYNVVLQVRKMDAAPVEQVAAVEDGRMIEEVSTTVEEPAPF